MTDYLEFRGLGCTMLTVKVEGSREHASQLGQEVHMLTVFLIAGMHLFCH